MAKKIITGFIVKGASYIADVETVIFEMRQIISKTANAAYRRLLQEQVERMVDQISTNQIDRPSNGSILDMAETEVMRRLKYADRQMQPTEFNLSAGVQIVLTKIDKEPAILLKLNAPNDIYSDILVKKIKELQPFHLYESQAAGINKNDQRSEVWNNIMEKYENNIPLCCSLFNYNDLSIKPESLKFRSPAERAADMARERTINRLIAAYACDTEIPPFRLVEYMMEALNRIMCDDIHAEMESDTSRLLGILPNITVSMITERPGKCSENTGTGENEQA